ncbi:acylneuraminate cytidylyltransferase family protein [Algoriphagus kandeliae]|uniref:Acylneuraminate cytidylyltransferase family protein n=1 Tax=Algoriphagus kandeliae TaxID=2562278 RepID=A0A4Y9R1L3_9BACT|nr:acylneuraminate cytidylyltransferase family protein [Algoriphagus kandeliae]TFV97226.1 acylneuraminate cytidylyltransferase family protein [Algoriphagus kandeliae]
MFISSNYQVIIPARKGSKRFPGKNKVLLKGKPLFQHSIDYAISEGILPENIWVNTDDEEILELCSHFGIRTYSRNSSLANDFTPTVDVIEDQLKYFKDHHINCDAVVLLQVTNPLRPEGLVRKALQVFEQSFASSLCTFSPLNKKFGTIKGSHFEPKNYSPGQRMQDIEPLFYENGLLYISSSKLILKEKKIIGDDVYPFVLDHVFANLDIDEPKDLLLAEFLFEKK